MQDKVKELPEALKRLQDLAVDVKVGVIELARRIYEKLVRVFPKGKMKLRARRGTSRRV